jgi:hypothetical protein
MKDGKYFKRYSQNFQEYTTENIDGYPIYRRRNNSCTVEIGFQKSNIKVIMDF